MPDSPLEDRDLHRRIQELQELLDEAEGIVQFLLSGGAVSEVQIDPQALGTIREAEETRARLAAIVEGSGDAILGKSLDGTVTSWNSGAERLYGWPAEEVLGRHVSLLVPGDRQEELDRVMSRLAAGERVDDLDTVRLRRDGRRVDVSLTVSPIRNRRGEIVGASSIARDITVRKRNEEALHRSVSALRELHRLTTDRNLDLGDQVRGLLKLGCRQFGLGTGVLSRWEGGRVLLEATVSAEPNALPGTALPREESFLLGVEGDGGPLDIPSVPGSEFRDHPAFLRYGVGSYLEVRVEVGGEAYGALTFLSRTPREGPCSDADLEFLRFAAAWIGARVERRQLEDRYLHSQKMEAVGRLAGGVAHDFNNLLSVIGGYGELLHRDLPPDGEQQGRVAEILKATGRAAALTRQLLAFGRRQVVEPRRVDLNEMIGEIRKMLGRLIGEDVELVTELAGNLPPVLADPGQMEQVIMNLAVNARDAMPGGGRLTLRTREVLIASEAARMNPDARPGPHVELEVGDTGEGMDPGTLAKAFEPFFTTKEAGKGTGLGLATVYGIVCQHGGHVEVDSTPGLGTAISIRLPRADTLPAPAAPDPGPSGSVSGDETVLVVEDEGMVRTLVRDVLEMHGFAVIDTGDPREVPGLLDALPGPVHLLLTDVIMPGMGGREVANLVRRRHPGVRILYMSGYADETLGQHGMLEPGVALLQKPFTPLTLVHKVREVLGSPAGE